MFMSLKSRIDKLEEGFGEKKADCVVIGWPEDMADKSEEEQEQFKREAYPELKGFEGLIIQVLKFGASKTEIENWRFIKFY